MVLKNSADSTNQKRLRLMSAHRVTFSTTACNGVDLYKCSMLAITQTQFAIQPQVTKQPNCMERLHVDDTIFSERAIFTFPTVDVCRARWFGSGQNLVIQCQSGNIATLLI